MLRFIRSTELFGKFGGKWIAVHNVEVIGVGDSAPEGAEGARTKADGTDFVLEALDPDCDVILGRF